MVVRLFRLARKERPANNAGRRYYKLVSYPHDVKEFDTLEEAQAYAEARQYAALLANQQWIFLNNKARQCHNWHMAGKVGYVHSITC